MHRVSTSTLRECLLYVAEALAHEWPNQEEREIFRKAVETASEERLLELARGLGMNLPESQR